MGDLSSSTRGRIRPPFHLIGKVPHSKHQDLIQQIDQLLPQTQCTQCDYPRCLEYAKAIATDKAEINQCPPGGDITIAALANLTGRAVLPLNPDHGVIEPRLVAMIDEDNCIGCKLCIKACPVDSIVGAGKLMHTVIVNECTGCKLCVPVCPTDCIALAPAAPVNPSDMPSRWPAFSATQVEKARQRTEQRLKRLAAVEAERLARRGKKKRAALKREIAEVLARKRANLD